MGSSPVFPGREDGSTALPLSPRLKPPKSHAVLATPRTNRGWNIVVPAEHQRGPLPTQSQLCHTLTPLEAPRPFLQPAHLSPGLWRGGGERSLSPSQVSGSESWIEGTFQLNSPHPESFAAALPLCFFPLHILGAHILALLCYFSSLGVLGRMPGSCSPRLTLPAEVRMELPRSANSPRVGALNRVSY